MACSFEYCVENSYFTGASCINNIYDKLISDASFSHDNENESPSDTFLHNYAIHYLKLYSILIERIQNNDKLVKVEGNTISTSGIQKILVLRDFVNRPNVKKWFTIIAFLILDFHVFF